MFCTIEDFLPWTPKLSVSLWLSGVFVGGETTDFLVVFKKRFKESGDDGVFKCKWGWWLVL